MNKDQLSVILWIVVPLCISGLLIGKYFNSYELGISAICIQLNLMPTREM